MDRKIISLFVFFFFLILINSGWTGEKAEKEKPSVSRTQTTEENVFRLAVQPTTKPAIALKRYKPIVDYLKEATKLNIELVITENYKDFSDIQKHGEVDFVIQDAFSAYLINQHSTFKPIANVISPEGKLYDPGYIIVRANSNIKELKDLKGKKLLFGPKGNAAKFLAPYILLKQAGIDMDKDLTYEFGGLCPDNAMSVFLGEYDASVVCGLYMAQKDKKFNFKTDLRILAKTGDLAPYWIVSASKKTDQAVAEKVKHTLLELNIKNPRTSDVLSICEWKGFAKYSDELNKIDGLVKKYKVPH